ncbi:MAG TPA: hypothetical protein VLE93_01160 [Candidatus Saccharimonadales bacterium]|nr:hypothetical protein [Candidatus Saccharimonadales bacterium]
MAARTPEQEWALLFMIHRLPNLMEATEEWNRKIETLPEGGTLRRDAERFRDELIELTKKQCEFVNKYGDEMEAIQAVRRKEAERIADETWRQHLPPIEEFLQ